MTPPPLSLRWSLLALLALAPTAHAACERAYTVGLSQTGTFAFAGNGRIEGLIPTLLDELTRRTGCRFVMQDLPRARLWLEWSNGAIDIVTGAVQTPERDRIGTWTAFSYVREEVITRLPPPAAKTLESWLDLPERPTLGRLRSAVSGGPADQLLTREQYAAQIEEAPDHATLIRKLYAKRNTGILLPRPSFERLSKQLGFDPSEMPSYQVEELPRVAYGFYLRSPQVSAPDRRLLIDTLDGLLKSGFNESAYASIVGKAVSAAVYHER